MSRHAALPLVSLIAFAGCASSHAPRAVAPANDAQRAALLDRVKQLQGTWEVTDDKGKPVTASVFAVSSGDSVVREIMFPGQAHEMTNVYHMDGPTMVMTHYCAMGNQPRLRAAAGAPGGPIELKLDSVSNFAADQAYMGELTLTMADADHVTEHWRSFKDGQVQEDTVFQLHRKK
jgi:hypothetical protein